MWNPWPTSPRRSSTGTLHVLEEDGARVGRLDAHLLLELAERDARRVRVDDERGDALLRLAVDFDRRPSRRR